MATGVVAEPISHEARQAVRVDRGGLGRCGVKYDPAHVQAGMMLYVSNCVFCHGVPAVGKGNIPNLAYVGREYIEHLDEFVFKGPFNGQGLPTSQASSQPMT